MKLNFYICDKCGQKIPERKFYESDPDHYILTFNKKNFNMDQSCGMVKDLCQNCTKEILNQLNYEIYNDE